MTVRPGEDVEEQQLHGTENGEHYDDGSGRDHEARIAVDAAARHRQTEASRPRSRSRSRKSNGRTSHRFLHHKISFSALSSVCPSLWNIDVSCLRKYFFLFRPLGNYGVLRDSCTSLHLPLEEDICLISAEEECFCCFFTDCFCKFFFTRFW